MYVMSRPLPLRPLAILIAIGIIGFVLAMLLGLTNRTPLPPTTVTADTEPVRRLVSVSGVVESEQTARLQFPLSGVVRDVLVRIGSQVTAGATLATLNLSTLAADRTDALATLKSAVTNRDELFTGITSAARDVSEEMVRSKVLALERTKIEQAQLIENARQTLLSSGLTVRASNPNEQSLAPTVSGTYSCEQTGTYRLSIYNSNSESGYSFRVSGLETGTYDVTTNQPGAFGNCGLFLQFSPGDRFTNSNWEITIPNPSSPTFIPNQNAYELAKINAESRIRAAEQELLLAEANARNTTAPARAEAVARANAAIEQAEARVARIDALIAERSLTAPFTGTVTAIDLQPGETATAGSGITLIATTDFTVVARIPEIDIGEIMIGQTVELLFDANPTDPQTGIVHYVSPTATFINGVAFFEVRITLTENPSWLRNGLNADIDIVVAERTNGTVRVPSRTIITYDGLPTVLVLNSSGQSTTTVEIELVGNDGYTAITGIEAGAVIIVP